MSDGTNISKDDGVLAHTDYASGAGVNNSPKADVSALTATTENAPAVAAEVKVEDVKVQNAPDEVKGMVVAKEGNVEQTNLDLAIEKQANVIAEKATLEGDETKVNLKVALQLMKDSIGKIEELVDRSNKNHTETNITVNCETPSETVEKPTVDAKANTPTTAL